MLSTSNLVPFSVLLWFCLQDTLQVTRPEHNDEDHIMTKIALGLKATKQQEKTETAGASQSIFPRKWHDEDAN